jgi:tetratricopeptide (TPR) repeat protein
MKYLRRYLLKIIPLLIMFLFSINLYPQAKQADILLNEKYGYRYEKENFFPSREYFQSAVRFHKEKNIVSAFSAIESALNLYTEAPYYYLYGLCFLNIDDYENAERAFKKALDFFRDDLPYWNFYGVFASYEDRKSEFISGLYTFDDNKNVREKYFSYYNLACIYSINMNLKKSFEYLVYAIEWGYPYINYIFSDVDLKNLFASNKEIKTKINDIYRKGFINNFSGKVYEVWLVNDAIALHFKDNKNIEKFILTGPTEIKSIILHGTYEIKNYQIIIHYNKETGFKGTGEREAAIGVGYFYERYDDYYSKNIDIIQIIPTAVITAENKDQAFSWKEKNLSDYDYFIKNPSYSDIINAEKNKGDIVQESAEIYSEETTNDIIQESAKINNGKKFSFLYIIIISVIVIIVVIFLIIIKKR